jgi:hypothetical protein
MEVAEDNEDDEEKEKETDVENCVDITAFLKKSSKKRNVKKVNKNETK